MKNNEFFKQNIFKIILCILTFLIGCLIFCSIAIGIAIKEQLIIMLISFLPFLIFL